MEFEVNLKEDKITETFKKMEKKYLKKNLIIRQSQQFLFVPFPALW